MFVLLRMPISESKTDHVAKLNQRPSGSLQSLQRLWFWLMRWSVRVQRLKKWT